MSSTCQAESTRCHPQRRGAPAQLGSPASAAAPRLSGSSGSRPPLALGCDGAHRPRGLAALLAQERGLDTAGLRRDGEDGGSKDGDARAAELGRGGQRFYFSPAEFCEVPPSLSPARGCRAQSVRREVTGEPRRQHRAGGGSSRAAPSRSRPPKGCAADSPPEPNTRLLPAALILPLRRGTSSPSRTLFASGRRCRGSQGGRSRFAAPRAPPGLTLAAVAPRVAASRGEGHPLARDPGG